MKWQEKDLPPGVVKVDRHYWDVAGKPTTREQAVRFVEIYYDADGNYIGGRSIQGKPDSED